MKNIFTNIFLLIVFVITDTVFFIQHSWLSGSTLLVAIGFMLAVIYYSIKSYGYWEIVKILEGLKKVYGKDESKKE